MKSVAISRSSEARAESAYPTSERGDKLRILNVLDEYTRGCLASVAARRLGSQDVILLLAELFLHHGVPQHIRSDHGPEFITKALRRWLKTLQVEPLYIEPGSPWENGYVESFNGKMRDQFLNGELCYTLKKAQHSDGMLADPL